MILECRINRAMWAMGLFVAGWVACSAYYKIPHLWAKTNVLATEVQQTQYNCENLKDQIGAADFYCPKPKPVEQIVKK